MSRPLVLAHRGASAVRPELTEAAIFEALNQGADGVEVDVVPSRDGRLVVRHDRSLAATTDVQRRLGGDRRVDELDRAALRTLRARERWPELRPRSARYDGREPLLELPAVVRLVAGTGMLLVVEIKEATAFAAAGLDPVPMLERDLAAAGGPIALESFEKTPLRRLAHLVHPLLYLLDQRGTAPDEPVADYASELARPRSFDGLTGVSVPASLVDPVRVALLHDAGLQVWAWTLRAENAFLPGRHRLGADPGAFGDWRAAWRAVLDAGVDAVFTDHPDLALTLRDEARAAP